MKHQVYHQIELTGTSSTSIEEAIERAISHAHKSEKHLCWLEVKDTRGKIEKGKVTEWQVTIKVGVGTDK